MRKLMIALVPLILINVMGCQHVSGNVVPQKGPAMEDVYDDVQRSTVSKKESHSQDDLVSGQTVAHQKILVSNQNEIQGFHKLANPELTLYVYPHIAGSEEVPIPGYYTVFNAYDRDHYVLSEKTGK
jgi:conjugative transfer region lipoprotein (TIGR03751 family)